MARRDEYDMPRFQKARMIIPILAIAGGAALATLMIARGYGVAESLLVGAIMLLWIPAFNLYKWWYKKRP